MALAMIATYLVGTTLLGMWMVRRSRGGDDWAVASGKMGVLLIAVGIAGTRVGGAATYGVAGDVITQGVWTMWYAVNTFLALTLVGIFYAVPYRRLGIHTVGEVFLQRFGSRRCQWLTSLCVQIEYLIVNIIEPYVMGRILAAMTGIPFSVTVLISGVVIVTYTSLGGIWGSSRACATLPPAHERALTRSSGRQYKRARMPSIQDLFKLTDRVAIVTGGSRGLGEEMAEGLAEAGAAVMICARRDEWLTPTLESFTQRGFRAEGMVADVSNPADVQAVVDRTVASFGRVDILVNNAGVTWGAPPEDMPLDKWQKVIDINLTGAFLFSQAAGREMLKREYGRIINIASIAGLQASVRGPHYAPYAASKAGLMGLTRELAASWGRQNIRVNAIAPGFFHSRLSEPVLPLAEQSIKASCPIPRVGAEGELKGVCVFLASDASNYITGQTIVVDGGRTIGGH